MEVNLFVGLGIEPASPAGTGGGQQPPCRKAKRSGATPAAKRAKQPSPPKTLGGVLRRYLLAKYNGFRDKRTKNPDKVAAIKIDDQDDTGRRDPYPFFCTI